MTLRDDETGRRAPDGLAGVGGTIEEFAKRCKDSSVACPLSKAANRRRRPGAVVGARKSAT